MKNQTPTQPSYFVPEPLDNTRLAHLCGPLDENLRQISAALDVTVFRRGERFIVSGTNADRAVELLERFYAVADKVVPIEEVQLALVEQRAGLKPSTPEPAAGAQSAGSPAAGSQVAGSPSRRPESAAGDPDSVLDDAGEDSELVSPMLKTRRTDLRGRTPHQIQYLKAVLEHDISFGIGPAGTGKTYLAVACAVDALEREQVRRILLVRPAVEAGEKLGFLPGDLAQKIDPYLRPLYDALYEMLGFEYVAKLIERQVIEIAPLAYMRGRTLNNSFIILDESQNTTVEQMKMFLTRIGFGSTAVITGDITQVDLPKGTKSGLGQVIEVLKDVPGISFTHFMPKDVVRHPLVQRIVEAYERFEHRDDGLSKDVRRDA